MNTWRAITCSCGPPWGGPERAGGSGQSFSPSPSQGAKANGRKGCWGGERGRLKSSSRGPFSKGQWPSSAPAWPPAQHCPRLSGARKEVSSEAVGRRRRRVCGWDVESKDPGPSFTASVLHDLECDFRSCEPHGSCPGKMGTVIKTPTAEGPSEGWVSWWTETCFGKAPSSPMSAHHPSTLAGEGCNSTNARRGNSAFKDACSSCFAYICILSSRGSS